MHVFYFTHLEPAGPCMFFISRSLVQRGRACFFFAQLGPEGQCMFFFSHTSGPRGRACFFFAFWALCEKLIFRTTNILTLGAFFWRARGPGMFFFRAPCAGGAVHVFFFAPMCEKLIFRTFRFSRWFPAAVHVFFFAPIWPLPTINFKFFAFSSTRLHFQFSIYFMENHRFPDIWSSNIFF